MFNNDYLDIYFLPEYGKLNERIENGSREVFYYQSDIGEVYYQFIKRPIDIELGNKLYFDITTPYGYGGPIIRKVKEGSKNELVLNFNNEFETYCKDNNIVSEFIRFHPLLKNCKDFESIYNIELALNTIAISLESEEKIYSSMKTDCRRRIKNATRSGVKIEIDEECKSMDTFMELYDKTMKKNNAEDFYFFPKEYFKDVTEKLKGNYQLFNAVLDNEIISSLLIFHYGDYMHAHLAGTNPNYYKISPNMLAIYEAALWGCRNKKKLFHLGGGRSNKADDNLLRFKASFNPNGLLEFYVSKAIRLPETYEQLCKKVYSGDNEAEVNFFPKYRNSR